MCVTITTHFKVSEQDKLIKWSTERLGNTGWSTSFKYDIGVKPTDWTATLILIDKTLIYNKYMQWELLCDHFNIIS